MNELKLIQLIELSGLAVWVEIEMCRIRASFSPQSEVATPSTSRKSLVARDTESAGKTSRKARDRD